MHVLSMESKDRVGTLGLNKVLCLMILFQLYFIFSSVEVNQNTTSEVSKQSFYGK